MQTGTVSNENLLIAIAAEIADGLRAKTIPGPRLKLSRSYEAVETQTNGWSVTVGRLHGLQTGLEIWLDCYSRHESPKFYACFWSASAERIDTLVKRAPEDWEIGHIGKSDYEELQDGSFVLKNRLDSGRFNKPIEEHYSKDHFFGFYEYSATATHGIDPGFIRSAIAFFSEIVNGRGEYEPLVNDGFPREENRKLVNSHLMRERSRFLAERCKQRDGYQCQVCEMKFAVIYGDELGSGFAEAHHLISLVKLAPEVKTRVDDLVTVCANCHRMLHRMEGGPDDINELREILKQQRIRSIQR